MKKLPISSVLLWLSSLTYTQSAQAHPALPVRATVTDSVGVEKKAGKRFILHRVDEGQTLYAIARRYGRSVAEIQAANPDLKGAVQYSQVVRIPIRDAGRKAEKALDKTIRKQDKEEKREAKANTKVNQKPATAEAKPNSNPDKDVKKADDPAKAGIHVIEVGQTLYSLAGRYGVSQADLRKWNNLPGNNVLIGQALIVSEKAYQARTPSAPTLNVAPKTPDPSPRTVAVHPTESRPTESRPGEPRPTTPTVEVHPTESRPVTSSDPKPERRNDRDAGAGEVANRSTTTAPTSDNRPPATPKPAEAEVEIESPRPGNDAPMPTRGRRMSASGVAEMIEGTDGSGKYLALHRTAPIGTLVQVRNEFNNQSLWVKVVGRLPNTGINDKILIKLSTQAFSKLSPEDRRFRAEVSYIVK